MRTTLTLDPDVTENLKRRMTARNVSLKQAVNEALRAGLSARKAEPKIRFKVEPHRCGFKAGVDLDKLNQLADDLDAEGLARKLSR